MEIISLKDSTSRPDQQKSSLPKITNLKQGIKRPNRVNVFLDGAFAFSLDVAQVVDFRLRVGQEITPAKANELTRASIFGKLYQRTLEWVLVRPRSIKETREYLFRKIAPSQDTTQNEGAMSEGIIKKLIKKGYLDDRKFAEYYIENRFIKKGISRRRLELELRKKGLNQELINQTFTASSRDDVAEIKKIIAKKQGRYDEQKLMQYLIRQGFDFELVRNLVRSS